MGEQPQHIRAHHAHCLGCGPENPGSLGLSFTIAEERVRSAVTFDQRHTGAPGFAHGGAVATALDDTLGTLLIVLERPGVTARLEVDYRRPAFLGRTFELEAWVERVEGRKLWLAAEMRESGEVVATARALFIEVGFEHFLQGGEMPDGWEENWSRGRRELPY